MEQLERIMEIVAELADAMREFDPDVLWKEACNEVGVDFPMTGLGGPKGWWRGNVVDVGQVPTSMLVALSLAMAQSLERQLTDYEPGAEEPAE